MNVISIVVLTVLSVVSKGDQNVVICPHGVKYDLSPGNPWFECASSLLDSLSLVCSSSGKFARLTGFSSIFQEKQLAMKNFQKDIFCQCCLKQCTVDEIRSYCP